MNTTMYIIENNTIVDELQFGQESDGIEQGFVTIDQTPVPTVGWSRVDENSDFTDTRGYEEKRELEYPELKEQLDKIYHDIDNGTLTTSGDFYTAINTVKTNHPKS